MMEVKSPKDTRILIVDDEPDFREILGYFFERQGYQVLTAGNGREAFDLIQAHPVDVVVSDIRMPGGDGIELLDRSKQMGTAVPIVLLMSGYSELTTEDAHNKGAEALFSKPFDTQILQETITRLLTSPEKRWAVATNESASELKIELSFPDFSEAIEGKVLSLGRGGMFVSLLSGRYANVSDTVEFKIHFDGNSAPLTGSGIIRWVRTKKTESFPPGYGIEFTYLDEPGKQQIIDFVAAKKPKAFIPNR